MSEENYEQVFQVSQPALLDVSNIRGFTKICTGDDNMIIVKAVKQTNTGDAERTEIKIAQKADGAVEVNTHFPAALPFLDWFSDSKPCKVEYVITAPRSCALKVKNVSADASVEGFDGKTSLQSVSGNIDLRNINGEVKVSAVSGDVKGANLAGPLRLNVVSGNVKVDESKLPSIHAATVSGDLTFETALSEGPYEFKSTSGDIELKAPAETRCSAELRSISGALQVKLPSSSASYGKGRQHVEIQGGGVKVSLNSISGDLEIKS